MTLEGLLGKLRITEDELKWYIAYQEATFLREETVKGLARVVLSGLSSVSDYDDEDLIDWWDEYVEGLGSPEEGIQEVRDFFAK